MGLEKHRCTKTATAQSHPRAWVRGCRGCRGCRGYRDYSARALLPGPFLSTRRAQWKGMSICVFVGERERERQRERGRDRERSRAQWTGMSVCVCLCVFVCVCVCLCVFVCVCVRERERERERERGAGHSGKVCQFGVLRFQSGKQKRFATKNKNLGSKTCVRVWIHNTHTNTHIYTHTHTKIYLYESCIDLCAVRSETC